MGRLESRDRLRNIGLRIATVVIGGVLVRALTSAQPVQAPQAPGVRTANPTASATTISPRQHSLLITPDCHVDDDTIWIYTAFEMTLHGDSEQESRRYLKRAWREGHGRYLWNLECSRRTMDCRGFQMDLTPSDYGEPIKGSDVATMRGAQLKALTGSFFVIQWGAYVLTVDKKGDALALRFDAGNLSGEGVGRCGKANWIGF